MKKGYLVFLIMIILIVVGALGQEAFYQYKRYHLESHPIEKYNFTISYPKSYEPYRKDSERYQDDVSLISVKVSGEDMADYMDSLNMTETVLSLKNKYSGMRLVVDAIFTEKTSLDIEEICKRYAVMFKVYNEDAKIVDKQNKIIKVGERDIGKVVLTLKGEAYNNIVVAYLFSLDDREVTVTFLTSEPKYEKASKEMDRIINSISFE